MKKFFLKKYLLPIILMLFLFLPAISSASELNLTYPTIDIPGVGKVTLSLGMDLNRLVAWFYYFIVGIAGFAAFIMLVWGGFRWLTSAGNPAAISDAKDRIFSALLGLLIILASYLILKVINPELLMLNLRPLGG